jgi:hypothetical protein
MQHLPSTTEPVSRNSLDEIFLWFRVDEKERAVDGLEPGVVRSEPEHPAARSGDLPSPTMAPRSESIRVKRVPNRFA